MNKKLLLLIVGVSIFVIVALRFNTQMGRNEVRNDTVASAQKLEVSTDPNFPEVKGRIISGFPDFPVYPSATLVASSLINKEGETVQGYRVKWKTNPGNVPEIMQWYQSALQKAGWTFTANDDTQSLGEQVAPISKGDYRGYVAAEMEGDIIEIMVDLRME